MPTGLRYKSHYFLQNPISYKTFPKHSDSKRSPSHTDCRNKAYDGGGEEHLTFHGTYCNVGGGLDIDTGIFTCPTGGIYLFQFHIATHDNKKALLSIRKNGEEIASIFDQNHKVSSHLITKLTSLHCSPG